MKTGRSIAVVGGVLMILSGFIGTELQQVGLFVGGCILAGCGVISSSMNQTPPQQKQ